MAYLQMQLDKLATSQIVLKNASAILFIIVTTDERGQTIHESLKKVESMVNDLDDELLMNLYNKILSVFLSGIPHQQIAPDDYFAFLERLGTLLEKATAQANEAHVALREAIGPEPVIRVWEGRDRQRVSVRSR
jgi:hypothetical protein